MLRLYPPFPSPSSLCLHIGLFLLSALCALTSLSAADPFAEGVRTTPWLKPEEERKLFKLPEGFEVNLVAAEPQIAKPLNMQFDERGRIWLTDTVEYPYPAPADRPGRDTIKVLEDSDGDGSYEKVTTFADGLNIPIGIYPWRGGCIAYSIPNIWHFEDADGDGVCDKRTKLYGPFDTSRDTHGMVNSFRRGFDGWIYACHGFNNDSRVKGADGHEIHMQSGNTFRFRPDGSRIEHFTHGQVNPFGMCFDELFNIYTADCHSKPIYQLVRGGYYPSFGKPHDGLGFIPPMMDHLHGSTAICGLAIYSGENFPPEYRGQFFSGNVMTSRINRNSPVYHGSTVKAKEEPDFLISGDPWFRPVDLHVGPDGALYVLDFYNRIIGHYEVPLTHPGRDRTSGRIWRIAYTGDDANTKPAVPQKDLSKATEAELIAELAHPVLPRRLVAAELLFDRLNSEDPDIVKRGRALQPHLARLNAAVGKSTNKHQAAHLRWIRERLAFDEPFANFYRTNPVGSRTGFRLFGANDPTPALPPDDLRFISVHALRMLGEFSNGHSKGGYEQDMAAVLTSPHGALARAAAEGLRGYPRVIWVPAMLEALLKVNEEDVLLRQTIRLAIKDGINHDAVSKTVVNEDQLNEQQVAALAEIALACPNYSGAGILRRRLQTANEPPAKQLAMLAHLARYDYPDRLGGLIEWVRKQGPQDIEYQRQALLAVRSGLQQQGKSLEPLGAWAEVVAAKLLAASDEPAIAWTPVPLDDLPPSESPWIAQPRASRDGDKDSPFFSSLPQGEKLTGIYRSGTFPIPEKLSFWCAGHDGFPAQPLGGKNLVRLRHAQTHAVLVESPPPRNDVAQRREWDLTKYAGQEGYLELIDGDTASGYAWLAVGRFSLPRLNPNQTALRQIAAAEIVSQLKLAALRPQMASLLADAQADPAARAAAGLALVALDPDSRAAALVLTLSEPSLLGIDRTRLASAIAVRQEQEFRDTLRAVMQAAPARLQNALAETLAGDAAGARMLIELVKTGHASARLLTAANVNAKLLALADDKLLEELKALTAKLPPASETLDKLIAERRLSYGKAKPNLARGLEVFTKNCAACHQLAGKGTVVAPQLDGIGGRGLERLLEDVLDPNRNVDVAFRTTTLVLADGRIVSGLVRREEGALLVLADAKGQEFSIPQADIEQQQKTPLSLMPANLAETLPRDELHDLLAFLLAQRANPQGERGAAAP